MIKKKWDLSSPSITSDINAETEKDRPLVCEYVTITGWTDLKNRTVSSLENRLRRELRNRNNPLKDIEIKSFNRLRGTSGQILVAIDFRLTRKAQ